MANTIEWNEALPENTDDASEGALRIRESKKSTREPVNRDHVFGNSSDPTADNAYADNTHSGFHRRVTFVNQDTGYNVSSRTSTLNNGTTLKVTELFASSQSSKHTNGSASDNVLRFQGGAQTTTKEVITDIQTQTLSNKTLTAPVITDLNITGTCANDSVLTNCQIGIDGNREAGFFTQVKASTAKEGFVGDLQGDVYASDATNKILEAGTDGTDATFTGVSSKATTLAITAKSDDQSYAITFVDADSGAAHDTVCADASHLFYNPDSNTLTTTTFAGALTGNVTADSGTSTFNNITADGTLTTDDVTGVGGSDLTLTKGSSAKIVLKNAGGVDISGDIVMQSSAGITCGPLSATTVTATGAATLTSISAKGAFSIKASDDSEKFAIAQASGNTTIAGTLNVSGTITGSLTGNVTGSVSGGDWNGNAIAIAKGGTGATSLAGAGLVTTGTGNGTIGLFGVEASGPTTVPTGISWDSNGINNDTMYLYFRDRGNSTTMGCDTWVSDRNLKENIKATSLDAIPLINKIKVKQWDWRTDGKTVELGLVAQDVEKVIPNAVMNVRQPEKSDLKNIKQLRPGQIIPYLLKAIQELSAEVKALKA